MKPTLVLSLLLPVTAWAQKPIEHSMKRNTAQLSIEQALVGMVNPHGLELATRATLYRNLSDTSGKRCAFRLRSGGLVIIKKAYPQWLVVYRAVSHTQFSSDTATYYMRKSDAIGAKGFILL